MIAILVLATLIAATSFDCLSVAAVNVTLENMHSISIASSTTVSLEAERVGATTVTIIIRNTVSVLALSNVSIISALKAESTTVTDESNDYMTIVITNIYDKSLSLFFASNADGSSSINNSSATTLLDNAFTQYAFSTDWAEKIYVSPNLNSNDSKVEDSYTDSSDIDVSYVNSYSVFVTCFFEDIAVFDCNIDLFKQFSISCNNQIEGLVCLNSAQNIVNESASAFFAVCKWAAYIYSNDNDANISNLKSTLISCCIDTLCRASSRQLKQDKTSHDARKRIKEIEAQF